MVKRSSEIDGETTEKVEIIEYSELSETRAKEIDDKTKEFKYNLGNILIFLLKTDKLFDLCNTETINKLYHKATKKIPYYDAE